MSRRGQRSTVDPREVNLLERKAAEREERFVAATRRVMALEDGRLVLGELLRRAGVYRSIWDPSAKVHYNAGRQDFGHELQAAMVEADETLYELMEREYRAQERGEAREQAAVQTRAITGDDDATSSSGSDGRAG